MPALPQKAVRDRVERPRVLHAEDRADLQVIHQVLADAGAFVRYLDAEAGELRGLADAGKLQDLGRVDGACGQQHFAVGARLVPRSLAAIDESLHRAAFEDQPLGLGLQDHAQVGPLHRGLEEPARRGPAHALALVHLEEARALVVAVVEVRAGLDAELLRGLLHRFEDFPAQPLRGDLPAAAGAVHTRRAGVVVLGLQEVGQHVVPAPAKVAELAPAVVVRRLAPHVDHAVDRRAPAQHLAARVDEAAPVEARLRRRLHHPVGAGVADAVEVAHRDVHPVVVVAAAGLQQEHAGAGVLGEPVREHAARRARAHDDVVVAAFERRGVRHPRPLPARYIERPRRPRVSWNSVTPRDQSAGR